MNALGDYIHFRNENYREFGVAKKNANSKSYKNIDIQQFLKGRLEKANAISNIQIKIAITELKKRMLRNTPENIKKDGVSLDKDFQKKIDKLYEILMKRTDQAIAGGLIYGNNAFGYSGDKEKLKSKGLNKKIIENKKKELDILNQKITELNKETFVEPKKIQELVLEFQKITNSTVNGSAISDLGKLQQTLLEYNFNT